MDYSDFFNTKVINKYWIELFATELDLSDTNQQLGRQTWSKNLLDANKHRCIILYIRVKQSEKYYQ